MKYRNKLNGIKIYIGNKDNLNINSGMINKVVSVI